MGDRPGRVLTADIENMDDRAPLHLLHAGTHRRTQVYDPKTGYTWLVADLAAALETLKGWNYPAGYVIRQRVVEVGEWRTV